MNDNEKKTIITNSKWATITIAIFTGLIWLWSTGHLPEFLIGILFSFSIWIIYFDTRARWNILTQVNSLVYSGIQVLLVLGDILIKYAYHDNVQSFVISFLITSFIVWIIFYGISLFIRFLNNTFKKVSSSCWFKLLIKCLSKFLIKGLSPGAVMFITTLCIGIISIFLPNATWKVAGVFLSTFFSSYKDSIKKAMRIIFMINIYLITL